jgi:hypothetical protein
MAAKPTAAEIESAWCGAGLGAASTWPPRPLVWCWGSRLATSRAVPPRVSSDRVRRRWPRRVVVSGHPPSCFLVLPNEPGTMQQGLLSMPVVLPVVMPRQWKRATRSNPVPVRGVAVRRGLRTAATTGAMTWLSSASRTSQCDASATRNGAEAYLWERPGRFRHLVLRVGTPRWS